MIGDTEQLGPISTWVMVTTVQDIMVIPKEYIEIGIMIGTIGITVRKAMIDHKLEIEIGIMVEIEIVDNSF
jgi:hypothetical protein